MLALPTTTVTIYEPAGGTDEWSGARVNDAPSASGVPMSIIEQERRVYSPNTTTPRVVRKITGRAPDGTVITTDSKIVDAEGRTYSVQSVRQPRNPMYVTDVTVELTRTSPLAT